MALRVVDQHLHRVEAHRLGVDQADDELGRVEQLEEARFVGGPGEGGGVALREAEAGERGALAEQLLGVVRRHALDADAALDELDVELLHLALRAPRPHRPPEPVRARRREARDVDRDLHHLLLVQDHAQGVAQDRRQAGMEVGDGLDALLAAQVRVDGVALDGARPDDRDLHHEVVEALGPRLGQRLHLGPALDLEHAHGVGRLEHLEHLGDLLRDVVEVEAHGAVVLDELDALVDGGEHAEPEQVELDQLHGLDVALVELDDDAVLHRRALDGGDVDEGGGGDEHAARVDAEVAREAVDAGAQLEPALPVGQAGDAAGSRALAGRAQDLRRSQPHDRVAAVLAHRHLLARPAPGGRALVARAATIVGRVPVDGPVERARPADREVDPGRVEPARRRNGHAGLRDPPGWPVPDARVADRASAPVRDSAPPRGSSARSPGSRRGRPCRRSGAVAGATHLRPEPGQLGSQRSDASFAADSGSPTPRVDGLHPRIARRSAALDPPAPASVTDGRPGRIARRTLEMPAARVVQLAHRVGQAAGLRRGTPPR